MYNIQGNFINHKTISKYVDNKNYSYKDMLRATIECFGEENMTILELINNADVNNPSDNLILRLKNITQIELNDLFTKNLVKNDNFILLINLLNEEQIKSIVYILNQEQL